MTNGSCHFCSPSLDYSRFVFLKLPDDIIPDEWYGIIFDTMGESLQLPVQNIYGHFSVLFV